MCLNDLTKETEMGLILLENDYAVVKIKRNIMPELFFSLSKKTTKKNRFGSRSNNAIVAKSIALNPA